MQKNSAQTERKILIVDDQQETLDLLHLCLTAQNYQIELAINGNEALVKLENNLFDLIMTDINMPGMNGNQLCQKILFDQKLQIPVIAITSEPWLATADFKHVVKKPFHVSDICRLIDESLAYEEPDKGTGPQQGRIKK